MSDSDCGVTDTVQPDCFIVNTKAPSPWWEELLPGDDVLPALLGEKHSGRRKAEPGLEKTAALEWLLEKTLREWKSLGSGFEAPSWKGYLNRRTEMTLASKNVAERLKGR